MRHAWASVLVAMGLVACGQTEIAGDVELGGVPAAFMRADPQGPAVVASLPSTGAAGTFRAIARNGDAVSFRAPDDSGFALRRGVVVSTFSLGFDLYSADVSDTLARLAAGTGGPATREHRYLDGEDRLTVVRLDCQVNVGPSRASAGAGGAVRDVAETCEGDAMRFTNTYILAAGSNRIISSRQWVSPEVGYLQLGPRAIATAGIVPVAIRP